MQNPQTWRAGRLLFVWPLTFGLSGMGVPTRTSRGPASIALGLIGARMQPHHVKVAIFGRAHVMTTGAVSAKTTTLIGFWNVRTMYEQGRVAQVIAEMKRYKLDILGVSESRWTKSERMKTTTGETVLYSGREDDLHHEGVAIIMKKGMEKYLMEWKPVNSRIIQARLKGRQTN